MIYAIAKALVFIYYRIFFRFKIYGVENIPDNGGIVVCANHISWADALTMAVAMKRSVHFMAKKELYSLRLVALLLRHLNSFPVDRSQADMRAYKTAINLLNDGKVLGIFVQGHRYGGEEEIDLAKAKSGAAFFALKANAPIVPAKITGSYKPFSRIVISFGQPLETGVTPGARVDGKAIDALTESIIEAVNTL